MNSAMDQLGCLVQLLFKWMTIFVLIILFTCQVSAGFQLKTTKYRENIACFFENTLIAGASVSSGYPFGLIEPAGEVLTEFYGTELIKNLASNGARSKSQISKVTEFLKAPTTDVSMVISLDMFFWDVVMTDKNNCGDLVQNVKKLTLLTYEHNVFLILSTVPKTRIGGDCQQTVNDALKKSCLIKNNCLLRNGQDFRDELLKKGNFYHKGINYNVRSLFQTKLKLHFSQTAQNIFADRILDAFEKNRLICN
ncbi:MAG: hypothetical protein HOO06_16180 [Bdellovibrionaceae bacterium]|jgi:hypothetical protein|nr:hypothetical protein [Pseudobdellovibrionaceae bacterium]